MILLNSTSEDTGAIFLYLHISVGARFQRVPNFN